MPLLPPIPFRTLDTFCALSKKCRIYSSLDKKTQEACSDNSGHVMLVPLRGLERALKAVIWCVRVAEGS